MMVALVLMIVYVLFKRLRVFLSKGTLNESYAKLLQTEFRAVNGSLTFDFYVPETDQVTILLKSETEAEQAVINQSFSPGKHTVSLNVNYLRSSNKPSFVFITKNQRTERFFQV